MLTETELNEDFKDLYTFISYFNYKLVTLSPQCKKGEEPEVLKGNVLEKGNRIKAFPPEELKNPLLIQDLKLFQSHGYHAFFMANEGDGQGAKRANVKTLKAVFIDTDGADTKALGTILDKMNLAAHCIVSTSPGKFHIYFFLEDAPATEENIQYWEAIQRLLHDLVPGMDKSLSDTCQLMRLPGFFNVKKELSEPYKATLKIKADFNKLPRYNLKKLYEDLGAANYNTNKHLEDSVNGIIGKPSLGTKNGHHLSKKYEFPAPGSKLGVGSRRPGICKYVEHILGNQLSLDAPEAEYFVLIDAFIITYLTPADAPLYLHGGENRANIVAYFRDRRNLRVQERTNRELDIASRDYEVKEKVQKNLSDDFYLNFPGDLGMLTREICEYSKRLPKEMAFAGALCISGFMKAESFRFNGAWPLINGFIVAGSGTGKSILKNIIERSLRVAGMRGKYSRYIPFKNTVQDLHNALYAAGGVGTTIIDETGDYLKHITSKNAPVYMAALKKYYKEGSTGVGDGNELAPGGSVNFTTPIIQNGMISVWMLIQPGKFTASISLEDMEDGFLPRFFVFNGKSELIINEVNVFESFKPSMDLEVWLQAHAQLFPLVNVEETARRAVENLKTIDPKAKKDAIRAAETEAVHIARAEARSNINNIINVEVCNVGERLVQDYLNKRQFELSKLDDNAPEIAIYRRIPEMLNRLICNAATYDFVSKKAVASADLIEKCIEFSEFQVNRFFKNELEDIAKGTGEHEEEIVLDAIKKYHNKWKEFPTVSQIRKSIRSTQRPKNIIDPLRRLIETGVVEKIVREHKLDDTKKVAVFGIKKEED
jgi:hypothetical protein